MRKGIIKDISDNGNDNDIENNDNGYIVVASDEDSVTNNINNNDIHNNNSNGIEDLQSQG